MAEKKDRWSLAGRVPGAPLGLLLTALAATLSAGCASSPRGAAAAPSAWLEIVRPLVIPAGSAHLVLQDGGPVAGFDRSRLYCSLEVDTVADEAQHVPAQRLAVRRVQKSILADEQANIPAFTPWTFSCSGERYYRVRIDLVGDRPPRVRNLSCTEWFQSCDLGDHATLAQIQQTLGPFIRWRSAESPIEPGRWQD